MEPGIKKKQIGSALAAALAGVASVFSCTNDPNAVRALTEKKEPPTVIVKFDMVQNDSGRITLKMHADTVIIEPMKPDDKTLTRRAIGNVEFTVYDLTGKTTAHLTSHRAIEHGDGRLSEALGDVVAVNRNGDTLKTERLIWDARERIYYSDEFTKIIQGGDLIIGKKGFRSNEDFTQYTLFQTQGEVSIKDSLENKEQPPQPQ